MIFLRITRVLIFNIILNWGYGMKIKIFHACIINETSLFSGLVFKWINAGLLQIRIVQFQKNVNTHSLLCLKWDGRVLTWTAQKWIFDIWDLILHVFWCSYRSLMRPFGVDNSGRKDRMCRRKGRKHWINKVKSESHVKMTVDNL